MGSCACLFTVDIILFSRLFFEAFLYYRGAHRAKGLHQNMNSHYYHTSTISFIGPCIYKRGNGALIIFPLSCRNFCFLTFFLPRHTIVWTTVLGMPVNLHFFIFLQKKQKSSSNIWRSYCQQKLFLNLGQLQQYHLHYPNVINHFILLLNV